MPRIAIKKENGMKNSRLVSSSRAACIARNIGRVSRGFSFRANQNLSHKIRYLIQHYVCLALFGAKGKCKNRIFLFQKAISMEISLASHSDRPSIALPLPYHCPIPSSRLLSLFCPSSYPLLTLSLPLASFFMPFLPNGHRCFRRHLTAYQRPITRLSVAYE